MQAIRNLLTLICVHLLSISVYAQVADTSKMRGDYLAGVRLKIYRIGYWDSLAKRSANKFPEIEVKSLDRLAFSYRVHGQMNKAMEYYNRSLAQCDAYGLEQEKAGPIYRIAGLACMQNEIKRSIDSCYSSLRIAERYNDSSMIAQCYNLLGKNYSRSGELQKALNFHFKSLGIVERHKLYLEYAYAVLDIGEIYLELRDTNKAVYYYLQSKKHLGEYGNDMITVGIYSALGDVYELKGQTDSADKYYLKVYKIANALGYQSAMAGALASLAQDNLDKGKNRLAEQQALKALAIVKEIRFDYLRQPLDLLLKSIYEKDKDFEKALLYYEDYVKVNDSVNGARTRKEALQRQYEYDLEKKQSANELLVQQNKIQSLKITKGGYLTWAITCSFLLVIILFFFWARQSKTRHSRQKLALEQKLLRSQMNPHFIFNSLQAIQNFVLKGDEKTATKYLSSFASLTRNVLESSRMEYISLDKELSLLNTYLQLQRLRFGDRFDYNVIFAPDLDPETILIPPMLCQPFIENAIEHGMKNKDEGGLITVSYELVDNVLQIEITDNGHGIESADQNAKRHRSFAIEITRERIGLMNKGKKAKTSFEISDAFQQEGCKGVKVRFNVLANYNV